MTRDEHRAEAERLVYRSREQDPEYAMLLVATAQVHATLATSVRPLVVHLPADTDFTGDDLHQFAEALKEALQ